jgi:hypothetical protein
MSVIRFLKWHLHKFLHPITIDESKLRSNTTPVLINNFNRLCTLKVQIEWLRSLNDPVSIIIVDNKSTYAPLLEYYRSLDYPNVQVVYLNFNSWKAGVMAVAEKLSGFPKFIVTDPDLLPYNSTPADVISYLSRLMDRYEGYNHIGLSLEINDIPDTNPLKKRILDHQSQFWPPIAKKINNEVYEAFIDTTFAMYRNSSKMKYSLPALRTGRPYTLKHKDWYLDAERLSQEFIYYLKSCEPVATWASALKKEKKLVRRYLG